MKHNQSNYRIELRNKHLLDILCSDYYLELGVIDLNLLNDLLNDKQLNLVDIEYRDLSNEGVGQIREDDEDIHYQVNYLVSLRQKNSTDKFFITCNCLRYLNTEGFEVHAPMVLIPVEIDYENFRICKSGPAIPNSLLLNYLTKEFMIKESNPNYGKENNDSKKQSSLAHSLDDFKNPKLNTFSQIDKYCEELASLCGLKYNIYNYLTTVQVEYNDYISDENVFDVERSIYSRRPEEITEEYFKKVKAILPTNISQKEAILKAANGESFVVNGKLGSGKTYTAINIICDQLAKGKKILYVNQDIDNLYDIEKNLNALHLENAVYNFSKNIKSIDSSKTVFPDGFDSEFDISKVKKIESYHDHYDYKLHGYSKRKIYEDIAVIKRQHQKLEPIEIKTNLQYFEAVHIYEQAKEVEKRLNLIDPYDTNCWRNISIEHHNLNDQEIANRTKNMLDANQQLLKKSLAFQENYFIKAPNNIADIYSLTTCMAEFAKARPLKSWLDRSTKVKVKSAIQELQNLSDTYFSVREYYGQNILNTYVPKKIDNIIERLHYKLFGTSELTKASDELYINKLLNEKNNIIQITETIKKLSLDFENVSNNIKQYFNINSLDEYIYETIEELYLLLSNNYIIKKWYIAFNTAYEKLMDIQNEVLYHIDELELLKKELSQYILKPEYLTFEYSDEAAKSPIFNLYARRYFNRKAITQAHLTVDHITDLYERFYKKQLEINQLVVDMTYIKKYSVEEQYKAFIAFCNYVKRLSKLEMRIIKNFFANVVYNPEYDYEKVISDLQIFLQNVDSLKKLENRLLEYKIKLTSHLPHEKINELLTWNIYLQDVLLCGKELEGIFKYNSDIHYAGLIYLSKKDSQIEHVQNKVKEKEQYFISLLGESFKGFDTDITGITKLIEYFDQFSDRFKHIRYIDQLFNDKFYQMVTDSEEILDLYNKWFEAYKALSNCFRGGLSIFQRQKLSENHILLQKYYNKINQLDDVIYITTILNEWEQYCLNDFITGIKEGKYKENLAVNFYYSVLDKYRTELEKIPYVEYSTDEFLNDVKEYNMYELAYCTKNIHKIRLSVQHDKRNNRFNTVRFNDYNAMINFTLNQRAIYLADLNIFNSNIKLSNFDLVLVDDGHLSTANKYNRIKECKQVIVFGDKSFRSSIVNSLMQRTPTHATIDFNHRYVLMSNKYNNLFSRTNQYIKSHKTKTFIEPIESIDDFVNEVVKVFYEKPNQVMNIIVGKHSTKRIMYKKLIDKLVEFYSREEITTIFNYRIKIIYSNHESASYVNNVFFFFDDYLNMDENSLELLFKNFTIVENYIFIKYIKNENEEENQKIVKLLNGIINNKEGIKKEKEISKIIIDDIKKRNIGTRVDFGFGAFDIVIRSTTNTGIIISGSKTEDIYSNIDDVNFYVTTYRKFGWNVIMIDIAEFVDDYYSALNKIIDLCKK